ncbi:hypothetical protein MTYM_00370 [Methylococcales bacterium]|nr:hypothetical protein MTYM_00370 [Methylococcales bacterium]
MDIYQKPPTIIKKCLVCSKAIQMLPHERGFLEWDSCNIRMMLER